MKPDETSEPTREDEPSSKERKPERLQRGEIRARFQEGSLEIRAERDGDVLRTFIEGLVAPFNEWTEIDSLFEGRFMERIAPSAFRKTLQERTPKVLFQHGHDPTIGDKPIGVPRELEERDAGQWFRVELFDSTSYVRDLIPALEAGQYGVSFRFTAVKEELVQDPDPSDHNPQGIPERTVKEATLPEFGPVTFPAYEGATVGLARSVFTEEDFIRSERGLIVPGSESPEGDTPEEPSERHSAEAVQPSRDYLSEDADERPSWAL